MCLSWFISHNRGHVFWDNTWINIFWCSYIIHAYAVAAYGTRHRPQDSNILIWYNIIIWLYGNLILQISSVLYIPAVSIRDIGVYECNAQFSDGEQSSAAFYLTQTSQLDSNQNHNWSTDRFPFICIFVEHSIFDNELCVLHAIKNTCMLK